MTSKEQQEKEFWDKHFASLDFAKLMKEAVEAMEMRGAFISFNPLKKKDDNEPRETSI